MATIDIKNVNHVYPGNIPAVTDASVRMNAGEFVSIVGPSGCGKTTLLNLVAGLVPLQDGTIEVAGSAPQPGRSDVSYMLARDCLFPWRTALDNVMLAGEFRGRSRGERRDTAVAFLERVGLGNFLNAYPKALSHGMRQRVALARTFSIPSTVMLMDEPFGALDPTTRREVRRAFIDLQRQLATTTLVVTHDLREACLMADRVAVLEAGALVAIAPPDELQASDDARIRSLFEDAP